MLAGASPIPASSGQTVRHRLNRGGDRQLNRALHTIALARRATHRPTRDYIDRRTREGKTTREINRCLKRYSPVASTAYSSAQQRLDNHRSVKVERFIRTLLETWAYAYPYGDESEREAALALALESYNRFRGHRALAGQTPLQRVKDPSGTNS